MGLFKVIYYMWNDSFSKLILCEGISVGNTKKEAIENFKKEQDLDNSNYRNFKAERIRIIMGWKIMLEKTI